jgi:hypothetical protein
MAVRSWIASDVRNARPRSSLGGGLRWARSGRASAVVAVCALTLALGAASAQALLLPISSFGSQGTGAGQFLTPVGVAVDQANGLVYVADSANARVDLFTASGTFVVTFGWGVADGKAQSEICASSCRAGIPGSGAGQFSKPTSVAVDSSGGPSFTDVYVGDQGNNVVGKFNALGGYLATIDGSTTPQGKYSLVAGVAVDQSGNLWTADGNNNNIDQFDPTGKFLQQWNDTYGSTMAIAVDSTNGKVYLIRGSQATESWTLTGTSETVVDNGAGVALGLDPKTGNLYVDHGGDAVVYDRTGAQVDNFTLTGPSSQGLAYGAIAGRLYVSDATNNDVTLFGIPTTPAAPFITGESGTQTSTTTATVNATVVPFGLNTACEFQYVDDATFKASGYSSAQSVPCSPADLGSSFTNVSVTAGLTGLAPGTTYHFRVSATNSDGTTNGTDQTFETAGPPVVVAGSESAASVTDRKATLNATVNPTGLDTTCTFQYVDNGTFQSSGYANAQNVPCSPADLGSSFSDQSATANVTGLTPGTTYHFQVVAINSAGTTNGPDQTFQTHLSFLIAVGAFGSSGTADGQFQAPVGVAAGPSSEFVADSANHRVEKFNANGGFVSGWGWGVSDGKAQSEVCTSNCQAGIAGPGGGQLSKPTSVAVFGAKVYVGDAGTNQVEVFNTAGKFLTVIDGATAPQGHFQNLAGVAADQSGNLWTADASTNNIDEFSPTGKFLQQWSDTLGSPTAIAVDSTHPAVYLIAGGTTSRFTTTGTGAKTVDSAGGAALSLDPPTGDLYVDHGGNIAIYDHAGLVIDNLYSLGFATNSQGLAYRASTGRNSRLYVSDATDNNVTLFGPRAAGRPFITTESATQTAKSTEAVKATIVPLGHDTTCTFQYVDDAHFQATGYGTATSVPCTPADLGSSFTYAEASANLTGLASNTTYHFRVVATNSAGTTTSGDQPFQTGPADWAPFNRCPVDDTSMLAADGVSAQPICVASNSSHGSITLGNLTTVTGNTNLQLGSVQSNDVFSVVTPPGGALVSTSAQILNGAVTATVENAGTPTNFNPLAGISIGTPIITLPIKIHLESQVLALGPNCFIGSDQNPILLNPATTDISHASLNQITFDPNGVPNPNGPVSALEISGTVQGDNSFAVPAATGCGTNDSLDGVINGFGGLPSPAGKNHLVLDDASSDLALVSGQSGQQLANYWHIAFG